MLVRKECENYVITKNTRVLEEPFQTKGMNDFKVISKIYIVSF